MASSRPAWQTDDLLDEWLSDHSASPSPSTVHVRSSTSSAQTKIVESTPTKSFATPLRVSIDLDKDEHDASPLGGTFLIRDDQPLPETPLGLKPGQKPKKGVIKDIFSPLALERLFDPPSPPRAETPEDQTESTTPPLPPTKPSLPPSKLSQSHLPPSEADTSIAESDGATAAEVKGPDEIVASDIPGLVEFDGRKPSATFKFTFRVPRTPGHELTRSRYYSPPNPSPNPRAIQSSGIAWRHVETEPAGSGENEAEQSSNPPLKLFHFQYDTFTRDHLGALADSIAVRSSPSASRSRDYSDDEEPILRSTKRPKYTANEDTSTRTSSSREFLESPWGKMQSMESPKGSRRRRQGKHRSRGFSSRRSRVNSLSMVLDGRVAKDTLISKIADEDAALQRKPSSTLTATASTVTVPVEPEANATDGGPKRNASNYRLQGANILAQIKKSVFGPGHGGTWSINLDEKSGQGPIPDASSNDDDSRQSTQRTNVEEISPVALKCSPQSSPKPKNRLNLAQDEDRLMLESRPSPEPTNRQADKGIAELRAKNLPHLSQSDIVLPPTVVFASRISAESQPLSGRPTAPTPPVQPSPPLLPLSEGRRLPSAIPNSLHPNHVPVSHDDMNRFVSSSTTSGISGTTAGSYVKHAGPPLMGQMRTIRPEEVQDVLPSRVGGMVYSEAKHRWVKQVDGPEDISEDPFGDIESLHSTPRIELHGVDEVESSTATDDLPLHLSTGETSSILGDLRSETSVPAVENRSLAQDDSDVTPVTDGDHEESDVDDVDEDEDSILSSGVQQTPKIRPQTLEELSEEIASMSLQMDLSPPRPSRPSTTQPVKPLLRSVLKSSTNPGQVPLECSQPVETRTPCPKPRNAPHRRSVSFSDGLTTGKIRDAAETSVELDEEDGSHIITGPSDAYVPSSRTKRIHNLLEGLDDSGGLNTFMERGNMHVKAEAPTEPQDGPSMEESHTQSMAITGSRNFSRPLKALASEPTTFLTEASFRATHEYLVRILTSVQPYEPYWEQLKSIDISNKGLESLTRLKELLPRLDRLSVLSSQTSYAHLLNLEELDISNNQVDSLKQLACLRHLRELKADGNRIVQLDGVAGLDSLVKVSLKGNRLVEIDFGAFEWPRVELLDLGNNNLRRVDGLGELTELISLNLDNNRLETLSSEVALVKLRVLRLSANLLTRLDVAVFPNVRTLYVDNNRLSELVHADRLTRLENLSLRSQGGSGLKLSTRDIRDIKRLYLSGNPLNEQELFAEPLFGLVYLELAACRLSALPANMSQMVPNVRVLNLNYNFLIDVAKPLGGMTRLRKLSVVGSRLKATKPVVRMLQRMPEMELLDFRMNPFSLGWYLPIMVKDLQGALQPSERGFTVGVSREDGGESGTETVLHAVQVKSGVAEETGSSACSTFSLRTAPVKAMPRVEEVGVMDEEMERTHNHTSTASVAPTISTTMTVTVTAPVDAAAAGSSGGASLWMAMDDRFRRDLPDEVYLARMGFRALVLRGCPRLEMFDGIGVTTGEREKGEKLLKGLGVKLRSKGGNRKVRASAAAGGS
ncbi:hypothetical protein FRB99_002007 [Tulasnella sp. 403]|nr:hypothetical protein FRB99_002007 [Tulasnella sp. 403]